jgi:hypothetical protein
VHNHFFLLDACRNDDDELRQVQNLTGVKILQEYPPFMYTRPPCYTPIFYASASGSQAWEPADPGQGISVFGQAIMDGLTAQGGLVPSCGSGGCVIPVHMLDGHLKLRVQQVASQDRKNQYAVLGGSPIDSNAVVTEVPAPKGLIPKGSEDRLGAASLADLGVPPTWEKFDLDNWHPIDSTPELWGRAHEIFGSEYVTEIWTKNTRLHRLVDGQALGENEGYVIHRVVRGGTRSYRIELSLTAERGNYWLALGDGNRAYALLLPDDLPQQAGYPDRGRPRFLLEVDFDKEGISRLDLGLSVEGPNIWLQKAATVARFYQRATLPVTLRHDDLRALRRMLDGGVRSPLASLVVAIVLLRAGQTDAMGNWLSELASRFSYLPDGPIFWAEWRLRKDEEPRPPVEAVMATLSLLERGLPLTNEALTYAMRQVDAYLLQQDLGAAEKGRLELLRQQLGRAFRLFRNGGLFCTFAASDPAQLTPELVRPLVGPNRRPAIPPQTSSS